MMLRSVRQGSYRDQEWWVFWVGHQPTISEFMAWYVTALGIFHPLSLACPNCDHYLYEYCTVETITATISTITTKIYDDR